VLLHGRNRSDERGACDAHEEPDRSVCGPAAADDGQRVCTRELRIASRLGAVNSALEDRIAELRLREARRDELPAPLLSNRHQEMKRSRLEPVGATGVVAKEQPQALEASLGRRARPVEDNAPPSDR